MSLIKFKSKFKSDGHSYLSNFYPFVKFPPTGLEKKASFTDDEGVNYLTSEHYYQYHKFLFIDPQYAKTVILPAKDALAAKQAATQTRYIPWKHKQYAQAGKKRTKVSIKTDMKAGLSRFFAGGNGDDTMRKALYYKFTQNPHLLRMLLSTGNSRLEEIGRFGGEYWANTGKNMLGVLLMELRTKLRKTQKKRTREPSPPPPPIPGLVKKERKKLKAKKRAKPKHEKFKEGIFVHWGRDVTNDPGWYLAKMTPLGELVYTTYWIDSQGLFRNDSPDDGEVHSESKPILSQDISNPDNYDFITFRDGIEVVKNKDKVKEFLN